jgi:hypothetical protein
MSNAVDRSELRPRPSNNESAPVRRVMNIAPADAEIAAIVDQMLVCGSR